MNKYTVNQKKRIEKFLKKNNFKYEYRSVKLLFSFKKGKDIVI